MFLICQSLKNACKTFYSKTMRWLLQNNTTIISLLISLSIRENYLFLPKLMWIFFCCGLIRIWINFKNYIWIKQCERLNMWLNMTKYISYSSYTHRNNVISYLSYTHRNNVIFLKYYLQIKLKTLLKIYISSLRSLSEVELFSRYILLN